MKSLILLFSLLHTVRFNTAFRSRIVNGTDADIKDYPYIISLQNRATSSHSCGGSILNERHVLTASHCVNGKTPKDLKIQYGASMLGDDSAHYSDVVKIIMHEDYKGSGNNANDVAVLEVDPAIKLGPTAQPTKLPSAGGIPEGSDAILVGWGLPYTGGSIMKTLQMVQIILYTDDDCESAHSGQTDRRYHLCAGVPEGGKGQCSGDSGGPLTSGGVQYGVVSWSKKPCTVRGYPGVFARVPAYVDWIKLKADME